MVESLRSREDDGIKIRIGQQGPNIRVGTEIGVGGEHSLAGLDQGIGDGSEGDLGDLSEHLSVQAAESTKARKADLQIPA